VGAIASPEAFPEAMLSLPEVQDLKRITQSLATLDLILCPDWEDRYYSYDAQWSPTEDMASMRNGCGDDWFILFDRSGSAAIKGFAHEFPAARDPDLVSQIRRALPAELTAFAEEPAFHWEATSFCYWRLSTDPVWHEAQEQEAAQTGAAELLGILADPALGYRQFASEYYEQEIDPWVLEHVLNHLPITPELVAALNPELGMDDIREDLEQVGYPR
jgi:hypothetical protein